MNEDEARGGSQLAKGNPCGGSGVLSTVWASCPQRGHETVLQSGSLASSPTLPPLPGWAPPPSGSSLEVPLPGCSWFPPSHQLGLVTKVPLSTCPL